ncbi:MFS transporter [Actinocatenispora rupis]|uniref:MFS transporter n=1 Tax=Actinocatenispora rupis TaxID=519421 RepID=A0A8J3J110_9ACTN|nr:MFS transporter [Actinocatenispora rupis]GID12233.1 MFS transporter [Actinocatenispora rupis]
MVGTRRRAAALAVLLAMQVMVVLDGTVVTVALPTIQDRLGFSPSGLAWVVNGYLVAFAGLLLLSGRLGDLLGRRRVFLAGLVAFTAASVVCGAAVDPAMLVAGRFVQGVGGALASAVILGMVVALYPEPRGRATAMGVYSVVSAGGGVLGLVAGGVLTETLGWRGAFGVNVPIGVATLLLALRLVPADRGTRGQRADVPGAVLVTAGLSLAVYAIVRVADPAAATAPTLVLGAAAVALLAAFAVRQATAADPLLPPRLLRDRTAALANLVVVLVFAAGFGFQFVTALYLQRILGLDALHTGLAFVPAPVTLGGVSLLAAGRLVTRYGARPVLAAGLATLGTGLLVLGRAPVHGTYAVDVLPALVVMGLGMGLAVPAAMVLAMSSAAPADGGLASGLTNTAQQAGAAVGLAVLAGLAAATTHGRLAGGAAALPALRDGYATSLRVAAGFAFAAVLVTLAVPARRPAAAAVPDEQDAPLPLS